MFRGEIWPPTNASDSNRTDNSASDSAITIARFRPMASKLPRDSNNVCVLVRGSSQRDKQKHTSTLLVRDIDVAGSVASVLRCPERHRALQKPSGLHNEFPKIVPVKRGVRWKHHFSRDDSPRVLLQDQKEIVQWHLCIFHGLSTLALIIGRNKGPKRLVKRASQQTKERYVPMVLRRNVSGNLGRGLFMRTTETTTTTETTR